jgi:hypothetical protein
MRLKSLSRSLEVRATGTRTELLLTEEKRFKVFLGRWSQGLQKGKSGPKGLGIIDDTQFKKDQLAAAGLTELHASRNETLVGPASFSRALESGVWRKRREAVISTRKCLVASMRRSTLKEKQLSTALIGLVRRCGGYRL